MKKLLLAASVALSVPALAGNWTFNQVGPFGYYHDSNGASYNSNTFGSPNGSTTYWNGFDAYGNYHSGSVIRNGNNAFGFGN